MDEKQRTYIAIDLKSFYASVECAERKLDPLTTNLVVADLSRTEKTICLAVSPSLKAYGISGRARLFEVVQAVQRINAQRLSHAIVLHKAEKADGEYCLGSESFDAEALAQDPGLKLGYITALPRMNLYMEYSARVYQIYLKYIAPEDIHVYSIDECFMDVTGYLKTYNMTARELAMTMIREVLFTTGITATGGIGTNLYLAKVAMDIVAKHVPADQDGVRIAELNERTYREQLWTHEPLTDFWRVGPGIMKKLNRRQIYTMGDLARVSTFGPEVGINENDLYKMFGINAELLIDHAWGREPCTMEDIKAYKPRSSSVSNGQVLHRPYTWEEAKIIVREMAEQLALDLVKRKQVTNLVNLWVSYDEKSLDGVLGQQYRGKIVLSYYNKIIPAPAGGSVRLEQRTNSARAIAAAMVRLYEQITDDTLLIRRIGLAAGNVLS